MYSEPALPAAPVSPMPARPRPPRPGKGHFNVSALRLINPQANAAALVHFFLMLRQREELVLALARRDILDRYRRQSSGGLWAIANPLLLMGV